MRVGQRDPTLRVSERAFLRASRTPDGPAVVHARHDGGTLRADARGPGAGWALEHLPGLVGADDDRDGFAPSHPLVARAARRRPGLRIAATGRVADVLVPTVLAQRVTAREAARAWSGIVRRFGEPAPTGESVRGLWVPPPVTRLANVPYWELHRHGVERSRAEALSRACRRMDRLEEALTMTGAAARRRLTALRGLGPWTAALVLRHAMGDPDAVEVGDFHAGNLVAWNLAGEPRGSDERMLELLAPFAGHRGRVVMLLASAGQRPPRFGPGRPPGPLDPRARTRRPRSRGAAT